MQRGKPRTRVPWNLSTLAFAANRIAAVVVALYLITHILVLSTSTRDRVGFDRLMHRLHSPFWLTLEMFLLLAVVFHGINGIRLILIDLGVEVRKQRLLLWGAGGATAVVVAVGVFVYLPIILRY